MSLRQLTNQASIILFVKAWGDFPRWPLGTCALKARSQWQEKKKQNKTLLIHYKTFQKSKHNYPVNGSNWGIIIPVTLQLNLAQQICVQLGSIKCSQPLLLEKQRGPLAHGPHSIHLAIILWCSHFWPASNYLWENKTLLLSIYAKTIVLLLPSQKLWQIIASLCLKGTKVSVRCYYSEGLHKHAFTHRDRQRLQARQAFVWASKSRRCFSNYQPRKP